MEPLEKNTYIKTHFSRQINQLGSMEIVYPLFCLHTKISPILDKEGLVGNIISRVEPETTDIRYVFSLDKKVSDDKLEYLQSCVNNLTDFHPNEALIYEPTSNVDVPLWYQEWMIEALSVELTDLFQQKELGFYLRKNKITDLIGIYVDITNFSDNYDEFQMFIIKSLKEYWSEGYVWCSKSHIEKLNLEVIAENEDTMKFLCKPLWDVCNVENEPIVMYLIKNML